MCERAYECVCARVFFHEAVGSFAMFSRCCAGIEGVLIHLMFCTAHAISVLLHYMYSPLRLNVGFFKAQLSIIDSKHTFLVNHLCLCPIDFWGQGFLGFGTERVVSQES